MNGSEPFRVFRLDGGTPVFVGTFAGSNAKEAVKAAIYADELAGQHVYEGHVLRNASVFETRSRDERFIDSVKQQNTQEFAALVAIS